MPTKLCSVARCPNVARPGKGRCDEHMKRVRVGDLVLAARRTGVPAEQLLRCSPTFAGRAATGVLNVNVHL
jgi:hypothetical protein